MEVWRVGGLWCVDEGRRMGEHDLRCGCRRLVDDSSDEGRFGLFGAVGSEVQLNDLRLYIVLQLGPDRTTSVYGRRRLVGASARGRAGPCGPRPWSAVIRGFRRGRDA